MVVVERGDVLRAKPEPDLFLACQERMGVHIRDCTVVGDAVTESWARSTHAGISREALPIVMDAHPGSWLNE